MKTQKMYRQGDVLLIRAARARSTKGLKEVKRDPVRGIVLARGEATGHVHHIPGPPNAAVLYDIDPKTLDRLLDIRVPSVVYHDEHERIELPSGQYTVRRQREYTPRGLRTVED